jgi:hypothetical protein
VAALVALEHQAKETMVPMVLDFQVVAVVERAQQPLTELVEADLLFLE